MNYLYEVLERLIAFDTVSSHSDIPAMDYIAGHLERHGLKTTLHRFTVGGVPQANLVAWAGPAQPDGLAISGHIDTVPVEGQPGWERDPFRMEVADDRIYGRGTADMKGFLAQCVDAASRLDHARLRRPLVFIFTANEEVGCHGAKAVALVLPEILDGVPRPGLTWIGEPTSYGVLHAHKSIVLFDVVVRGLGGHSGAPEQGVNAIAVMGKLIDAIGRLQAERRTHRDAEFEHIFPESPHDVMNFGTIAGGIAVNVIAEECVLKISYRSLPNADPLEIHREVKRLATEIDTHDYGSPNHRATIEVGEPMVVPPLMSPRGTALERALFEATGTAEARGALFGTDGGWFSRSGMVPLICGPGDYEQAHRPNEFIRRDPFERGPAMILKVIDRLCR
jgi:acetylornithine deacetylase